MSEQNGKRQTKARLLAENEELRLRLEEAEQTLEAIRHGEVDALVVVGPPGEQIYTLSGAEHIYRVIVETMNEAALMVDTNGTILFCNQRFCDLVKAPIEDVVSRKVTAFAARPQQLSLRTLLQEAQAGPLQRRLTLCATDDTTVPIQLSASLLQTDENKSICLVATDLTELEVSANSIRVLREHQQALEASEMRFRAIFESSQDAVLIANNEGVYVQANPAVQDVFGLPPEKLIGRRVADFLPEDANFPNTWQTLLTTGQFRGEMRLVRADGQMREVEAYAVAGILPGRHLLVIRDITERKQAEEALLNANAQLQIQSEELQTQSEELRVQTDELRIANDDLSVREGELRAANEALRESEQKYQTLFNSIDQGFCIVEVIFDDVGTPADYRFLQTNAAFERQTGLHEAEGQLMRELAPEHEAHWFETYGRIARTGKPERFVNEAKALGRWYDVYAFRIDEPQSRHVAILFNDITERRQAEEALRLSEEKFRNLHRMSPIAIVLNRLDNGQFLETNQAMWDMTGYTAEELRSLSYWDLTPIDYKEMEAKQLELLRTVGRYGPYEKEYIRKDGTRFPVLLSGVRITDPGGTDLIYSVIQDITEPKARADALRESEERLKRAQEIAHLGSWELDLANDRLSWSDEVYRIFGLQPQEFGASYEAFLETVHPEDRAAVDAAYSGSVRNGRDSYEIEHRIVRKSTGEVRIVHEKCQHVRDASGRIIRSVGMVHDITERKRAEEALRELTRTLETRVVERTAQLEHRARQLQRLTLELSEAEDRERRHLAEILHDDLQQQLAAAKFHLSLLSNRAKNDPSQQMMIGQIDRMLMEAIQKSRSLSHELSPAVLYQGGLADALGWLAEQIKTKHGLEVAVDAFGTVAVESDALKTFLYRTAQELLFNVVKHARVGKARIRIRCLGHCICLSVSDRGRGFDPQALREAAGFGLLSIRERVELLGGRMKIHSAPGHGATFHIVVPDGQQKAVLHREVIDGVSLESPLVAPAGPLQGALHEEPRLRVLLADDHEIVREGLASLLQEEAGIQVVGQAANGREAVDLADRLRPDVVVMDVAMPLINGDEATRQIKMHLPGTRVVALSMYQEADLVERMHRAGAESYVLKTAPAEELLAAIRGHQPAHAL